MNDQQQSLETLADIKRMMERSSRFLSLSGISGVCAGIIALAGAYIAQQWLNTLYANDIVINNVPANRYAELPRQLVEGINTRFLLLAASTLALALLFGFYFTWRRVRKTGNTIWNPVTRKLTINLLIPLGAGGLYVLGMMMYNEYRFVAPACLIFYGLALINCSKYTLTDVRYLGMLEIALGVLNMFFIGYGLYFWAIGFGILHIVYGVVMWWKYERGSGNSE
jgi:hypothetical protein